MDVHQLRDSIVRVGSRLRALEIEAWDGKHEELLKPEILKHVKDLSQLISHLRRLPTNSPSHDELCALAVVAANNFFVVQNIGASTQADINTLNGHALDALAKASSWVPDGLKGMRPPSSGRSS